MSPQPHNVPPQWPAGFVDGELPPDEYARIERLLAEQPEQRNELDDQEALAPTNTEYWKSVEPPPPTAKQWASVLSAIHAEAPARSWRVRWVATPALLASAALVATAAMVLIVVNWGRIPTPNTNEANEPHVATSDVEEPLGFLQLALHGDIEIHCLPEDMASLLITGQHPLGSDLLLLARSDEIEFHGIGADPEGRFPEVSKDPMINVPPVIWAPNAP